MQTAQKQVASAVTAAVAAETTGNQAAIAKADAVVQTAANAAATASLNANAAPNPGPTVDCGGNGQSLSSSQLANGEITFAAAVDAGLTDNEAVQMVAASCQESGLNASSVNSIGASGLFQLYSPGYKSTAEQLGGLLNPVTNTEAILPSYVAYWKANPNAPPGAAAAYVEDSGEPASWYAEPAAWMSEYFRT